MKKTITIISLIGALLVILDSVQASHWFVLFFLAGVIPGTNILIPATGILAANATAITIVIVRLFAWPTLQTLFFSKTLVTIPTKKRTTRAV